MKKEDLKASFDQIMPSEFEKKRMLDNILNHRDRKKGISMPLYNIKKAIPALVLTVVIAGGLLTYNIVQKNNNYDLKPEYGAADDAGLGREDSAAPLVNQFQIDDRHYILLSDDLREEYGFPATVNESDIGEKITDIAKSPDKSLIGSEVYKYIPAGCEAVVAVKKDNEYQLFCFFVFESYNNNQDEDAVRYLELYGINKADDIAKIQFIGHSEESKLQGRMDIRGEIRDRDEIARFYSYYSALKNSSDKYFDRLFNYNGINSGKKGVEIDAVAPDYAAPDAVEPDNIVSPDGAGVNMAAPDNIASPDASESNAAAPNQTGYGESLPVTAESVRAQIAEDQPLAVTSEDETGRVSGGASGRASGGYSGDTPAANETPAEVAPSSGIIDMGGAVSESGATEPSRGSAGEALANPISIRIYNQSGVYYESVYYINLGFISRYEISKEFAGFIGKYLDK
ncbi:MAG TPA: hypothetical protein GXX36_16195 [Clostridiaceae bacterium]|nr:hypothetical protein [Clostridiaceae bacterium]